MTGNDEEARHLVLREAARRLEKDALAAAAACEAGSPEWRFYHGVMAAALDQIHPERGTIHEDGGWLDAQPAPYRAGFIEATTALAQAAVAGGLPTRVPLPHPPASPLSGVP